MKLKPRIIKTDVLIIGGGAAGCFNAISLAENSKLNITIADKANIKRSGCLSAGINALNAYISEGETADTFLEYVKNDSEKIIRDDLVYTIAKRLNSVTDKIVDFGLPVLRDSDGKYTMRSKRSVKINGENIKPILSNKLSDFDNINVINNINIIDYITIDGKVAGAYGILLNSDEVVFILSKITVCATGGASGIYKPNNPNNSRHKMWYSPFNTGAGYAMGIRAGAEMTTFEMRFIALRCKDTIAPTGTIAQGVKAKQINSNGEYYVKKYGPPTTPIRLYSTVMENKKGNRCFLETKGISKVQEFDLYKAYLNMAPAQTLKWFSEENFPSTSNVEIEGTEPYIVGGHTASGYWVDTNRKSTIERLYAIGDVAGGSPKKYVTGCFAEGEIAADSILQEINNFNHFEIDNEYISDILDNLNKILCARIPNINLIKNNEKSMQDIMDKFAGGISQSYVFTNEKLAIAENKIAYTLKEASNLKAYNTFEIMHIFENIDRLYVAKVLIQHLKSRKETRWRGYQENGDFPDKDDQNWSKFVNSKYEDGKVKIIFRDIIGKDEKYEHKN